MGGTIAFEVAQQLQAAGEPIALLALFDTMDWSKIPLPSIWSKADQLGQRLVFHAAGFLSLDFEGKTKFLREKLEALRNRIPVWRGMLLTRFGKFSPASMSESRLLGRIWQTNDAACVNYIPRPYPGLVTDFRPKKQYRIFNRPDAKWDQLAQAGQDIVVLPVYPAGMLVEPFVKSLAMALKKSIDGAIASCESDHSQHTQQ
jgi:thioesterase domain-containing protein